MENDSDVGMTQPDDNQTQASAPADTFAIPEEYKQEGWTQNLKSYDDLWKMNANAQKMVGKKSLLPNESSSDEEWQGLYQKMRPESQNDYGLEFEDADEKAFFEKTFYENGVSKKQAQAIASAYKQASAAVNAEMYDKAGYDKMMSERFGDKSGEVQKAVTDLLAKELSQEDQSAIEAMPNNIVGVLYGVVNTLRERYAIKDSDLAAGQPSNPSSGQPDFAGYAKAVEDLNHRPHSMADMEALKSRFNIK